MIHLDATAVLALWGVVHEGSFKIVGCNYYVKLEHVLLFRS